MFVKLSSEVEKFVGTRRYVECFESTSHVAKLKCGPCEYQRSHASGLVGVLKYGQASQAAAVTDQDVGFLMHTCNFMQFYG